MAAAWKALGPSFILSPLKLGGPTRLRLSLSSSLVAFLLSSPFSLSLSLSFLFVLLPALPFSLSSVVLSPLFRRRSYSISISLSLSLLVLLVLAALSHT